MKLAKAKSTHSKAPQLVKSSSTTSNQTTREKTLSIAQKVKEKISNMKENQPVMVSAPVSHKSSMIKDYESSSFHTNPLSTMRSFNAEKQEESANYFSKYWFLF